MKGAWIGVDLDRCLAYYEDGQFPEIGRPIPAMVSYVKGLLEAGCDVRIFTARANPVDFKPGEYADQLFRIDTWCLEHLGQLLPVTCSKDYRCIALVDDIARPVEPNTGRLL